MISASPITFTALDAVREAGITIASDGAEFNSESTLNSIEFNQLILAEEIGEFAPTDATTNPSLVYAAVSSPEYFYLVDEAVKYAQSRIPSASIEEKTDLALDRLVRYT